MCHFQAVFLVLGAKKTLKSVFLDTLYILPWIVCSSPGRTKSLYLVIDKGHQGLVEVPGAPKLPQKLRLRRQKLH